MFWLSHMLTDGVMVDKIPCSNKARSSTLSFSCRGLHTPFFLFFSISSFLQFISIQTHCPVSKSLMRFRALCPFQFPLYSCLLSIFGDLGRWRGKKKIAAYTHCNTHACLTYRQLSSDVDPQREQSRRD